jgi:hypothetical protein
VVAREGNPGKLDFEVFVSCKIFDRKSKVRFHKRMLSRSLQKSRVHDSVHGQSYIKELGMAGYAQSQY